MQHATSRRRRALPAGLAAAQPAAIRAALAAIVAAALIGACQAPVPASPSAVPSRTPTLTATPTPPLASVAPTVSATPAFSGIPAAEVAGRPGVLAPGRYTRGGFEPRITFELDGPWRSVNAFHGFFDVQQDVGSPDVIAVQFAQPDQVYGGPGEPVEVTTAEAAVATLRANPRLRTVETSASRIGGLDGFQVTVENPADRVGDAPVLHVSPGALSISPGRRLWCAFFDTPDGVLAILVGGSVARWDTALSAAEPVLESVTIGE